MKKYFILKKDIIINVDDTSSKMNSQNTVNDNESHADYSEEDITVNAGEIIYNYGDIVNYLYIIKSGQVQLNCVLNILQDTEYNRLESGNFVGICAIMNTKYHLWQAVAVQKCQLTRISRKHIYIYLQNNINVIYENMKHIARMCMKIYDYARLSGIEFQDITRWEKIAEYGAFYFVRDEFRKALYYYSYLVENSHSIPSNDLMYFEELISLLMQELTDTTPHIASRNYETITCHINQGEIICSEGFQSHACYVVQSGGIEIFTIEGGKRYSLLYSLRGEGQWVGLAAFLVNKPYKVSVQALSHCELIQISRSNLMRIMQAKPQYIITMNKLIISYLMFWYTFVYTYKSNSVIENMIVYINLYINIQGKYLVKDREGLFQLPFGSNDMFKAFDMQSNPSSLMRIVFTKKIFTEKFGRVVINDLDALAILQSALGRQHIEGIASLQLSVTEAFHNICVALSEKNITEWVIVQEFQQDFTAMLHNASDYIEQKTEVEITLVEPHYLFQAIFAQEVDNNIITVLRNSIDNVIAAINKFIKYYRLFIQANKSKNIDNITIAQFELFIHEYNTKKTAFQIEVDLLSLKIKQTKYFFEPYKNLCLWQ